MNDLILHGKVYEVLLMITAFKQKFGNITLKELFEKLKPIERQRGSLKIKWQTLEGIHRGKEDRRQD